MNKNKEVELDDLGSLSHLSLQLDSCLGLGEERGGEARVLKTAEILAGSSLVSSSCSVPCPPLEPEAFVQLPPPWKFMHAGESMRVGSGQGHEEARTGASHSQISPHFLLEIILLGKEAIWKDEHRAEANSPSREVVFQLLTRITWPSLRLIIIL